MTGCADWAANAALPIAVPLRANRLPDHNHGRGTCDQHLCPRSNGRPLFPSGRSLEPAPTGPGATCGLVSGVMKPPQGLQICEVSIVTTRLPPRT